ncbi:hypothetical protein M8312_03865 [Sphingomonas sp. KRR8]|uniref:hypothetical protein n=1 Tax=Sphingomonas sp. KRR8 TaxID=2942996 RepID=UPI002022000B|nr:hypothetical protein [Sphingomonas sp. KRR8]URD61658.1 hypothetical protein M8312_03865 [Sphingomonas sp. KRR8]
MEESTQPAMWVKSRQFTGRIVTVTNDKIFDEPVYNYTDQFAYVWEEFPRCASKGWPSERLECSVDLRQLAGVHSGGI